MSAGRTDVWWLRITLQSRNRLTSCCCRVSVQCPRGGAIQEISSQAFSYQPFDVNAVWGPNGPSGPCQESIWEAYFTMSETMAARFSHCVGISRCEVTPRLDWITSITPGCTNAYISMQY